MLFANPLHGDFLKPNFPVDVQEKNGSYVVNAELPGVKKENVEINIDNDRLTISASIEQYDQKSNEGAIIQSERYFGSVSRTIFLPTAIDKNASTARFKDGLLEITLGKLKNTHGNNLEIKS